MLVHIVATGTPLIVVVRQFFTDGHEIEKKISYSIFLGTQFNIDATEVASEIVSACALHEMK